MEQFSPFTGCSVSDACKVTVCFTVCCCVVLNLAVDMVPCNKSFLGLPYLVNVCKVLFIYYRQYSVVVLYVVLTQAIYDGNTDI